MIFCERDAGIVARIRVGTVLEIRLLENPTTGCRWHVVTAGSTLQLVSNAFLEGLCVRARRRRLRELRTMGRRVVVLVALVAGATTVHFDLRCSSAPSEPPDRRLVFPLDVY